LLFVVFDPDFFDVGVDDNFAFLGLSGDVTPDEESFCLDAMTDGSIMMTLMMGNVTVFLAILKKRGFYELQNVSSGCFV